MIKIHQNNNFSLKFTYRINKVPTSVNGWEYVFVVKKSDDLSNTDVNALIKKRELIIGGLDGVFYLNLTAQQTNLPIGVYNSQLLLTRMIDGERQIVTIYNDKVSIIANIIKEV